MENKVVVEQILKIEILREILKSKSVPLTIVDSDIV